MTGSGQGPAPTQRTTPTTSIPSATQHPVSVAQKESWRRLIGLGLLSMVVILWTASGFLQSSMFADDSYSKPYFVTYINTAFFILPLAPYLIHHSIPPHARNWIRLSLYPGSETQYKVIDGLKDEEVLGEFAPSPAIRARTTKKETIRPGATSPSSYDSFEANDMFQRQHSQSEDHIRTPPTSTSPHIRETSPAPTMLATTLSALNPSAPLSTRETLSLSFRFCLLWYTANYFNAASYAYTSVASVTIFSTTSSIFTLIFGSLAGVETFTYAKLGGVVACLVGVAITCLVEAGTDADHGQQGAFPSKSAREIIIGDALALAAAALYGAYTVLLVKTVGDESRVRMPLFFGFLGLINIICLWPGFPLLSFLSIESFSLPPTAHIWMIIVVNSLSSLVADLCWAYAMLFTSPLVVTVGLSLTIPLSLVGQIFLQGKWAGVWYWGGAGVVVASFVFVNSLSGKEGETEVVPGAVAGNTFHEDNAEDDEEEERGRLGQQEERT